MRQSCQVLLVQAEPALATALKRFLEAEGCTVNLAYDGVTGLNLARRSQHNLILLDAELPGIDGITLCGAIRGQLKTPIILLINRADELQHMIGLDRGADVCLVKPVSSGELRARIRALLRRSERAERRSQLIAIGALSVDTQVRRAWLSGAELRLTPKEFELLAYLMQNCGMALTRDQLLKHVWGGRVEPDSQTLEVHIRWLRQKVELNPREPMYIRTVRMIGYRFQGPQTAQTE